MASLIVSAPANCYEDLLDRINKLSSDTDTYKTQVNIVGGVFIGIIILLITSFVYFYILLQKSKKNFDKQLTEADPLRRSRAVMDNKKQNSEKKFSLPNPVPNRFQNIHGKVPVAVSVTPNGEHRNRNFSASPSTPVANTPNKFLNAVDSPMHFGGNTPSTLNHFEYPPNQNVSLQRQPSGPPPTPRFGQW